MKMLAVGESVTSLMIIFKFAFTLKVEKDNLYNKAFNHGYILKIYKIMEIATALYSKF